MRTDKHTHNFRSRPLQSGHFMNRTQHTHTHAQSEFFISSKSIGPNSMVSVSMTHGPIISVDFVSLHSHTKEKRVSDQFIAGSVAAKHVIACMFWMFSQKLSHIIISVALLFSFKSTLFTHRFSCSRSTHETSYRCPIIHTRTHTPIIFAPIKFEPCDYRLREKCNQNSTGDIAISTDATENGLDSVHGHANPQD